MDNVNDPIKIKIPKMMLLKITEVMARAREIIPTAQNQSELLSLCSYSWASHSILGDGCDIGTKIIS
jgi:hypothetical protein